MVIIYFFCLLHAFLNFKNKRKFFLRNLENVINFVFLGVWGAVMTVLP